MSNITPGARPRWAALLLAGACLLPLAACAPEPADIAGQPEKGQEAPEGESSWQTAPDDAAKKTELPESFPHDTFPLPEGAAIDDTGERAEGQWFVVLLAEDEEQAERFWDAIVSEGGFEVGEEQETVEGGRMATLTSTALSVQAMTIPQEDGSVLLSFDLTQL